MDTHAAGLYGSGRAQLEQDKNADAGFCQPVQARDEDGPTGRIVVARFDVFQAGGFARAHGTQTFQLASEIILGANSNGTSPRLVHGLCQNI